MKRIMCIVLSLFFFSLAIVLPVSAGSFSSYDTQSFGGHINITTPASPPSFTVYDTQSFGGHIQVSGDATIPEIIINFAGNLSDSGGPYWQPPGESVALSGVWSDGYYTNDSRQSENFTYINITINEPESDLTSVYLNWYNQSSDSWIYDTYSFSNMTGGFWEISTSEHFDVFSGHNYSFNINATSEAGTNWIAWNKTGLGGSYTRRYVQLNSTTVNISYTPYYCYDTSYATNDANKHDRLHHDQGSDGGLSDTGYLLDDLPDGTVQNRYCSSFTGFWFDESQCIKPMTLTNVYYHIWYSAKNDTIDAGWNKTRERISSTPVSNYSMNYTNNRSSMYYNGGTNYDNYYLDTNLLTTTGTSFTDNNIYELSVLFVKWFDFPSIISNRSFISCVYFNVPSNETLNATGDGDTDGDGLSDWEELFETFTLPDISDTDNDGVNDYDESRSGSDPNNYTDTQEYSPPLVFTPYDTQSFGGYIQVTEGTIDIDVAPASWDANNPSCGSSTTENFTFYQNGSATIDTKIGFNKTNYTFVTYATWLGNGHDQYCANVTIDTWVSETNIAPKVGGVPVTSLKTSVNGNTNFGFGIRIYMPKTVSTANLREDFKVMFNATIS